MEININKHQLINITKNYYQWEKEKEILLTINKDNPITNNKNNYYLLDSNWLINYKTLIKYDNLLQSLNKVSEDEKEIENIINQHINVEFNSLQDEQLSKLNNMQSIDLFNEIKQSKKFPFTIINEIVKNSINDFSHFEFMELNGNIIGDKIIFELEPTSNNNYNMFIVIFSDDNYFYELFFIFNIINETDYIELLGKIKNSNYQEILNLISIKLNDINEIGEIYNLKDNLKDNLKNNLIILAKKTKKLFINNKQNIDNTQNNNNLNSSIVQNQKENSTIYNNINSLFKCMYDYDLKLMGGFCGDEIRNNYSPCKLIDLNWVLKLKNVFKFEEKEGCFKIKENIDKKDLEIFDSFRDITSENIEKGEFYIVNELFFVSLYPFIKELEKNKNNFPDNEIYLYNGRGAIIINKNIYIFEIYNNDVNQRHNYLKIKEEEKDDLLTKMADENIEYKLNDKNWQYLKDNALIKKDDNNKNQVINDINIINNHCPNDKHCNNNNKNENSDINNENINTNNIINLNNSNNILNNNNIEIFLFSLFEKEKYLNERYDKLKSLEIQNQITENVQLTTVTLDKFKPTIGLENLGATCYMNATLQCMAHFIEISEEILTWYKYNKSDNNKQSRIISYLYAEILDNIFFPNDNQKYYSPRKFKELISTKNELFKGIQANDSKDIYNYLIEEMHKELNALGETNIYNNYNENVIIDQRNEFEILNHFKIMSEKNYHSILSKYLYAIQKTVTKCSFCDSMVYNFQVYNFLLFPLLDVKNYFYTFNLPMQNHILNLYDCFNYFQKIDFFTGQNQIFCNNCKFMQNANYFNLLHSTPIILSIVLNRGKNNEDFKEQFNLFTELDLSCFVEENKDSAKYYLIGVICHIGESSMDGHFFSYCRSCLNSPWYKYNDAIVSQCNENEILNAKTPYILFYHKYQ